MLTRKLLWCAPVAAALGIFAGLSADKLLSAGEKSAVKQDIKPAVSLPITRVVLFNSGVGYFSRSGEVVDDSRVDLMFPEQDINDLLKSMVLEDFDNGRIAAVSYDSREPIARTLSSFAINLNGNPTFAGIISQMRGERVDVVLSPGISNQPGKLSGSIVGVEKQKVAQGSTPIEVDVLNMWCAEGLRSVRLTEIQQLKFANPVIESEFRRALDVLAMSHDSLKKAVSLHFAGQGKRKVQVGYVVEAPIWKTSYRLVLADKEKPYLQGWAMVENPTDEDWAGVKMALISGRPISFKMDLYNPLYVDRPVVEPELFASLRPVTYRGGFGEQRQGIQQVTQQAPTPPAPSVPVLANPYPTPVFANGIPPMGGYPVSGGGPGALGGHPGYNYNSAQLGQTPIQHLTTGGVAGVAFDTNYAKFYNNPEAAKNYAANVGRQLGNRMDTGSVGNAATAGALGDFFQYTIDHPVTLARQKSALLPIVGKQIEGQRISIYNQFVQGTHPLLGLKFKNTSGLHLNQGPITVFEGSVYAGDTRVLDVQPNEERILSYAIDLGVEVDPKNGPGTQKITSVKAMKGIVTTTIKAVEEKNYRIVNRSQTDRTLVIEHPNRTNQRFKLVSTEKPAENTPEFYRFQTSAKAGDTKTFTVKEELDIVANVSLTNSSETQMQYLLSLTEISPTLKQKLTEAMTIKGAWDGTTRELKQVMADLERLQADQERIRKNLRETPKEAEVYSTYLKKLSDQEKEIDSLTEKQKKMMAEEFIARKKYEDYLGNISD
ncbi:MAG TPA: DUF4139 domain-containing protein [Gemmata sp.]|jgi:hypothetical protein|nr:DUF4139 domain-containing protein [Gemmata sp.]